MGRATTSERHVSSREERTLRTSGQGSCPQRGNRGIAVEHYNQYIEGKCNHLVSNRQLYSSQPGGMVASKKGPGWSSSSPLTITLWRHVKSKSATVRHSALGRRP